MPSLKIVELPKTKVLKLTWFDVHVTLEANIKTEGYYDWADIDLSPYVPADAILGFFKLTLNPTTIGTGNMSELDLRPYDSSLTNAHLLTIDKQAQAIVTKTTVLAPLPIYSRKVSWSMLVGAGWTVAYGIELGGYGRYEES